MGSGPVGVQADHALPHIPPFDPRTIRRGGLRPWSRRRIARLGLRSGAASDCPRGSTRLWTHDRVGAAPRASQRYQSVGSHEPRGLANLPDIGGGAYWTRMDPTAEPVPRQHVAPLWRERVDPDRRGPPRSGGCIVPGGYVGRDVRLPLARTAVATDQRRRRSAGVHDRSGDCGGDLRVHARQPDPALRRWLRHHRSGANRRCGEGDSVLARCRV